MSKILAGYSLSMNYDALAKKGETSNPKCMCSLWYCLFTHCCLNWGLMYNMHLCLWNAKKLNGTLSFFMG